ncbi:UNVERIFIED_CONTAM: poly-beta-hydroxybutyrate polymerase, partial [Bacteroidetes bacterium 56_B9]
TFVLTSGGHNAGVVSEPGGGGRRHYRIRSRGAAGLYVGPEEWPSQAELREGSWWPAWAGWLDARTSGSIAPPATGSVGYPAIDAAPGRYVHER